MEFKATKYKTESQKSSGLDGWISFNPMHVWRKVILRGVMQTLTPRDGQTNQQMRTFSSIPDSFQFPSVKSVCPDTHCRQVTFSHSAVLSRWPCPQTTFCSARNYFPYCCPLCSHKCKNKCCALKKLWSEIPQIWTYTMYDLTAFCQRTLIIQPGRNSPGLWISQTCSRLDPAHPKLPLYMWVGTCSVRSLHGRSIAVLKPSSWADDTS